MPRVYIPNKSMHDFGPAEKWGELIFLTEGRVNTFKANDLAQVICEGMADSEPIDFVVLSGSPILSGLAMAKFAHRHGRVNLLIYNGVNYESRQIVFPE